ncbi:MAG: beta galactosidase jelly roll domain-containing protein [Bacteroidota bacterium]
MKQLMAILVITTTLFGIQRDDPRQVIDLRGKWKFEIGDSKKYSDPNFDDKKWDEIFVPADWENEGFAGYDGYAWYRKTFTLSADMKGKKLFLHLGYVDDACAVYVNGKLIGEGGRFEPDFLTAYNQEQKMFIPSDILLYGKENIIAVRVFDTMQNGGIVRGKIGIFEHVDEIPLVVEFPERWKFKTGDHDDWKNPEFNDSGWDKLLVPAKWDFQGYRDYNGYAWYRVTFDMPKNYSDGRLVLMLGMIDDVDETYLNGEQIGKTGRLRRNGDISTNNDYIKIRGYEIPRSLLKEKNNVVAVRVYDGLMDGGIYSGPIGIVSEKDFSRWERKANRWNNYDDNPIDRFLRKLFSN